jgi:predicted metal-binding protein
MREMMEILKEKLNPKRIGVRIQLSKLKKDLEKYRRIAIDMGADRAEVISSKEIIIDERVRAKCIYPKCVHYGTNINCPPYAPDLDFVRKLIGNYRFGILFGVKSSPQEFLGVGYLEKSPGIEKKPRLILNQICAEIESLSFYEGYQFSLAFGQGPCKSFWCPDKPCAALEPGGACRFSLKSRSSMEAVGMDVFKMVSRRGWEIYPCGERVKIESLPHVLLVGLILIY